VHFFEEAADEAMTDLSRKSRSYPRSNRNPLDFIKVHLIALAIVELRRAGRGVVRHGGGVFERAAVFQVRRDPGRTEGVIADLGPGTASEREDRGAS
jgi:hypothetical protein